MTTAIWLAILVVCVILILVIIQKSEVEKSRSAQTPDELYQHSNGTLDNAARAALNKTINNSMAPEDHFRAATILTRNVVAQEEDPNVRADAYITARNNYLTAIVGITERTQAARAMRAERRAIERKEREGKAREMKAPGRKAPERKAPPARVNQQPANAFMIDAVLDFALGGMAFVLDDGTLLGPQMMLPPMMPPVFRGFPRVDVLLMTEAKNARAVERKSNVEAAREQKTPAARTNTYIRKIITHTNDPQNSHDTSVNAALRALVGRLRDEQGDQLPSIDAIEKEIEASAPRWDAHKLADVKAVIQRLRGGERNIAVGITDGEALQRTWLRADSPSNKEKRDKIREAVYDNLYDCWTNALVGRHIICVNGRTARILGSLATLDADERNWNVTTAEQHKNSIFDAVKRMIKEEARTAAASLNPELSKVGRYQLAETEKELDEIGTLDHVTETEFLDNIREKIARFVDGEVEKINQASPGAISPVLAENIRKDAVASVL